MLKLSRLFTILAFHDQRNRRGTGNWQSAESHHFQISESDHSTAHERHRILLLEPLITIMVAERVKFLYFSAQDFLCRSLLTELVCLV